MQHTELIKLLKENFTPAYYVDKERKIKYWNQEAESLTAYSLEDVKNKFCFNNILEHIDKEGTNLCENGCPLHNTIEDGKIREADVFLHHKEGARIPVKVRAVPVRNKNEEIVGAVEFFINNNRRSNIKEKRKKLKRKNLIDNLTEVNNREHLEIVLEDIISEDYIIDNKVAFCFVDIDDFKFINDNYGHLVGDKALKMFSKSIDANLRPSDQIFRWGGDEFALLIYDLKDKADLKKILRRLLIIINNSFFELDKNGKKEKISITTSWGATFIKENDSPEKVLKRADSLMYESKKQGKNRITIE